MPSLFIDGAWTAGSGGTAEVINPFDASVVETVDQAGRGDVDRAVAAARAAFDTGPWRTTPARERGALLRRVADLLVRDKEKIAHTETLDTGKTLVESRIDVDDVTAVFRYYADLADKDAGRIVDTGQAGVLSRVVHEPVGVCVLITPWNYPLLQLSWKVAPALAAGNTCVIKPSEVTPLTSIMLVRLCEEAGVPPGVVNIVLGDGRSVGAPLTEHPAVDMVSFTGGLATWRSSGTARHWTGASASSPARPPGGWHWSGTCCAAATTSAPARTHGEEPGASAVSELASEPSARREPAATFDYVIVGGGSAGCALASRLSEDPSISVCLLEAGPSDVGDPAILKLADWMALLDSGYDWDYLVEPQERGNSFLRHARAKVLGGCSSHNSCIAFWTPREDLDEWATSGCEGWSAEECWPLIRRLETNDGEWDGHGRSGPVNLMQVPPDDPCGVAVLEAAAAVGLPTVRFNEGATVCDGAGFFQINQLPDGTRASASVSYLHPVMGSRPNLEIRTGAWASRVLFDGTRATGVEYQQGAAAVRHVVGARREVVLCAGAIDTPKLLMLSGIGPAHHLRDFGVDVVVDAPGVGANLDDHVEGLVMWEAARPMVTRSTQWWEIGLFHRTEPGLDRPDLMMHYGSVPFDLNTVRWGYPTTDNGFCLTPNVTRGRSRGTVRLRSRDFRDRAKVDPRYFTDPEDHDMGVMLAGVKLARRIAEQPALKEWIARELTPGPDAVTDDDLIDYIRRTHNTVYHPACTAKMGPASDPTAVLDPQLRVRGVQGLRVADASVLPFLPAINPNITCMMVGEKASELLRGA